MAWLKRQGELISATEKKSIASDKICEDSRRLVILSEKKRKLEAEMRALEDTADSLAKKIEARGGRVRRMNGRLRADHGRHETAIQVTRSMRRWLDYVETLLCVTMNDIMDK